MWRILCFRRNFRGEICVTRVLKLQQRKPLKHGWLGNDFCRFGKTKRIRTKRAASFREGWLKKCLLHGQVGPFPLPNSVAPLIVWRGRGVFRQFSAASFYGTAEILLVFPPSTPLYICLKKSRSPSSESPCTENWSQKPGIGFSWFWSNKKSAKGMCFKQHLKSISFACIGRQASRCFSLQRDWLDRSNPSILTGRLPSLKLTARTWKLVVWRLLSLWEGLFSGVMLVSGRASLEKMMGPGRRDGLLS